MSSQGTSDWYSRQTLHTNKLGPLKVSSKSPLVQSYPVNLINLVIESMLGGTFTYLSERIGSP